MVNKEKKEILNGLLAQRDFEQIIRLCDDDKRIWKILQRNLYEIDEKIYWPAIEAIGALVHRWWDEDRKEMVTEYMRSMIWSLNDESGGIGWNAPQVIAEIAVRIPELTYPYASIMIDRTMGEPPLVKNCLWAIGRIGPPLKEAMENFQDIIFQSFTSKSPPVLGTASWAMGEVGFKPSLPFLEDLTKRKEIVQIYCKGMFIIKILGEWATESIRNIQGTNTIG